MLSTKRQKQTTGKEGRKTPGEKGRRRFRIEIRRDWGKEKNHRDSRSFPPLKG